MEKNENNNDPVGPKWKMLQKASKMLPANLAGSNLSYSPDSFTCLVLPLEILTRDAFGLGLLFEIPKPASYDVVEQPSAKTLRWASEREFIDVHVIH